MDKAYTDTVRLLLSVAPDVFRSDAFAMKGGTAINLFVRDMPRLSVDIDVVYTRWNVPRDEALGEIAATLAAAADRLRRRGLQTRAVGARTGEESKLVISDGDVQVKVEANQVFRGTVLPVESRELVASTSAMFSAELRLPVHAVPELYGSKIVAALDRQHPRDLFDVLKNYESDGLSEAAIECMVTYLAGHNRPIHEVLFASPKDITKEYDSTFVGMTADPVSLDTLLATRERLFKDVRSRLTDRQKRFLIGLSRAAPDWSLLACQHARDLPALRWKLENLERFRKRRREEFERQAAVLESRFAGSASAE